MSFVYACYICLVSLRLVSSWSLQRCCLLLLIKQLSVVPVRPVSPVSPVCRLSYAEIMQTESRIIKSCLNVMPRCRLSYCRDNANREQNHQVLLVCYAEMPLILCRDNANREQNHQVLLECYAEMQLILCKDNANWHNYKIKICQRSHYFSSLPFKMTFFSQFALLHHVLRNIIYDFFINRNTINHSRPIVRNIDMSVTSYPQSPD